MIIGAAMPRTGTMSLRNALKILGIGESYHAHHIFGNQQHIEKWLRAANGNVPNYRSMFSGYCATLDGPACLFWEDILNQFPGGKVLLLYREPEAWYASMISTIYPTVKKGLHTDPTLSMINDIVFEQYFEGRFEEQKWVMEKLEEYYQSVRTRAPVDRLLEYQISDGWAPLCTFLSVPIPNEEFPKINTREAFLDRNRKSTV